MDFTFILDHLATGAAISSSSDVDQLAAAGVTHVIDCRDDFDDASLLASRVGLAYLWNGTPDDGKVKPPAWFQASIAFALPAICAPPIAAADPPPLRAKVYAHCAAGINRGPSTAFAIMLALGFRADVAEQIMRAARPQVGLAYKDDALRALKAMGF